MDQLILVKPDDLMLMIKTAVEDVISQMDTKKFYPENITIDQTREILGFSTTRSVYNATVRGKETEFKGVIRLTKHHTKKNKPYYKLDEVLEYRDAI